MGAHSVHKYLLNVYNVIDIVSESLKCHFHHEANFVQMESPVSLCSHKIPSQLPTPNPLKYGQLFTHCL